MSDDVANKLTKALEQIKYKIKTEKGDYLNREDLNVIFETLRKYDQELSPILETFERLAFELYDDNHFLVKECILEVLKYYNIVDNSNLMKTRHKIFFTESKNNIVNKPFLSQNALDKIKAVFNQYRIFDKI